MEAISQQPFTQAIFDELVPEQADPQEQPELIRTQVRAVSLETFGEEILDSLVPFVEGADPFFHIKQAFDSPVLADTPNDFLPSGDKGWYTGAYTALALLELANLYHVSYQCENSGSLFVNLVALPGQGRLSEKSKKDMRGHTDACSFPLPNEKDESGNLSSSPDFVVLIGLRNPDNIPTCVAPLVDIMHMLSESTLAELLKHQFVVGTQATFDLRHEALDVPFISVHPDFGYQIRFSHSRVVPADDTGPASIALDELKTVVEKCLRDVVIRPGDLLLINNRTALHGRRKVGGDVGGKNRWLQRTYANRKTTPVFPVDAAVPFRLRP